MEDFKLGDGRTIRVHDRADCTSPCVIHSPLDGPWDMWPIDYDHNKAIMYRICPHGGSHPCVEQFIHWVQNEQTSNAFHVCDGCPCAPEGVLPDVMRIPVSNVLGEVTGTVDSTFRDTVERANEDVTIDIPSLGIEGIEHYIGRRYISKESLERVVNGESFSEFRKTRARIILDAYQASLTQVKTPDPEPTPIAMLSDPEPDPNVVAQRYLDYLKDKIESPLHEALTLLANSHAIYEIRKVSGRSKWVYQIDGCEMDCSDFFDEGQVATDDNHCVTLKLAILGGYKPQIWSGEDS